jgi:ribonuclease J
VAVIGRSLVNNIETASALGRLRLPPGLHMDPAALPPLPDEEMVLLVTGSQGEPMSALSRIATGEHRHLDIHRGDTVLMSSRLIPGNTMAVNRLINTLYRQGAEVLYESVHAIHASGHAHKEELLALIRAVRPEYFVPVHGEYRHLVKNSRLACACGVDPGKSLIIEDGQPFTLLPDAIRFEEPVEAESILVDGKGVGDVGQSVLRERHLLGGDGLVVVNMILDEASGEVLFGPEILSKGFVFEQRYSHVLEDSRCLILDLLEEAGPLDPEKLRDRTRSALRRFFRKVLGRDPVVIPVITAI